MSLCSSKIRQVGWCSAYSASVMWAQCMMMTRRNQLGSGTVQANGAGTWCATEHIGFEPGSIFTIGDQDDVVDPHTTGVEQVGIDRDGADVILPGFGHPSVMQFGMKDFSKHGIILKRKRPRSMPGPQKNQKIRGGFSNPCPRLRPQPWLSP